MTAFAAGDRVVANWASEPIPGTVVELHFPFDALAVTPVIWDDEKFVVAVVPSSTLVPYLTEDEELEKLAQQLGFPPRPVRPPAISDAMPEWLKQDGEWRESLRQFKKKVRDLARKGGES